MRPIYWLPGSLTTAWLSFSLNENWLILRILEDNFMAALEIDLSVDDYTKAVGQRTNGKIVYQIGITPQTSMYFEKSENALYYIEEGTQKFVKRVMTETVQDGELLSLSLDEASISDPILIACAELANDNTTRFR